MQSNINIIVMDALHMLSKIWMIHAISCNRLVIHVQYKLMLNHNVPNETCLINASNAGTRFKNSTSVKNVLSGEN